MKLHLPNGLRKAVMACMAAVATLTTTIGTGIIAGGAVTYMLAAQQAEAADETFTMSDLATGATNSAMDRSYRYVGTQTVYEFSGVDQQGIKDIIDEKLLPKFKKDNNSGCVTIAAWVNPDTNAPMSVLSYGGNGKGFTFLIDESGKLALEKRTGGSTLYTSDCQVSANAWTLIALTLNFANSKLMFISGENDSDFISYDKPDTPG
ncbi:MAG: hypothetical protein IJ993_05555, partial [Akkermansia sp.]|nr:hypothetical protein [Akkermansia sp.]